MKTKKDLVQLKLQLGWVDLRAVVENLIVAAYREVYGHYYVPLTSEMERKLIEFVQQHGEPTDGAYSTQTATTLRAYCHHNTSVFDFLCERHHTIMGHSLGILPCSRSTPGRQKAGGKRRTLRSRAHR